MEPGIIYFRGDYLWMLVFPTRLCRTCLTQSRHSRHICWMSKNPLLYNMYIMKNSIGHKYQEMTLAKLSKKMEMIRGIYAVTNWSLSTRQSLGLSWSPAVSGGPGKFPSSLCLSLGSCFLVLSHWWPFSALQDRAFIFEFIGLQFQKENSPALFGWFSS